RAIRWTNDRWEERDLATNKFRLQLDGPFGGVQYSDDGRLLAVISIQDKDGRVICFDAMGKKFGQFNYEPHFGALSPPITFSPDGRLFAGKGKDLGFALVEVAKGEVKRWLGQAREKPHRLKSDPFGAFVAPQTRAFSSNGRFLVAITAGSELFGINKMT